MPRKAYAKPSSDMPHASASSPLTPLHLHHTQTMHSAAHKPHHCPGTTGPWFRQCAALYRCLAINQRWSLLCSIPLVFSTARQVAKPRHTAVQQGAVRRRHRWGFPISSGFWAPSDVLLGGHSISPPSPGETLVWTISHCDMPVAEHRTVDGLAFCKKKKAMLRSAGCTQLPGGTQVSRRPGMTNPESSSTIRSPACRPANLPLCYSA